LRALPPVVVSGLPNMTPIFSRSWFIKTQEQPVLSLEIAEVRFKAGAVTERLAPYVERRIKEGGAPPLA